MGRKKDTMLGAGGAERDPASMAERTLTVHLPCSAVIPVLRGKGETVAKRLQFHLPVSLTGNKAH